MHSNDSRESVIKLVNGVGYRMMAACVQADRVCTLRFRNKYYRRNFCTGLLIEIGNCAVYIIIYTVSSSLLLLYIRISRCLVRSFHVYRILHK